MAITTIKKLVYLDKSLGRVLKRLSVVERVPETEIVRRALDTYARERLCDPLLDLIGTMGKGPSDGARRHDEYLLRKRAQ